MQVTLQLQSGTYDCLLNHVPGEESDARRALKEATKLNNTRALPEIVFTVLCAETQARVLLDIAKEHCPQAVHEIEFAIQTFGAQPV